MTDSVELCARAFAKIGQTSFERFADGSLEGDLAAKLYGGCRDRVLSVHPWNFALKRARLVHVDDFAEGDYAYGYALPSDFLRAVSVGYGDAVRGVVYRLLGDVLECDAEMVSMLYGARVEEARFPPFFQEALVAHLAAEFCLPLTENSSRSEVLARRAQQFLQQARLIDAQQDTPLAFDGFSLLEGRE
ncbi:MAG: hypothetical protein GDA50_02495 [Alphaproteobacteria bacterium GM202ARS2]|nr:hypothetical protein [Alphaproteobacteria bacterium GM202ARS2]